MAHICKWRNYNPQDEELQTLIARIWGEEFNNSEKRIEKLMKQTSWLQTFTMFCDECYLVCVNTFLMNEEEIEGLK